MKVNIILKFILKFILGIFISALIAVFGLMLLIAFNKAWAGTRNPTSQPNTEWMSEDESITFYVDNEGRATGTMVCDNKVIKFQLSAFFEIYIYTLDQEGELSEYVSEVWECSYKSKKKFVATVKKTTFFKEGQKITFYRK